MTDIPSAYDSVPSHASAGTTPACGACGRPVVQTWFYINARAFHPQCLALYDVGYRDEITRLRSRVAELENGLTDTLSMLRAAHMQCGIHHAGNKRVIKARSLLSQSTENGK